MRIWFERSGGFAGLHLSTDFDLDDLDEDDANQIKNLIDEADFFEMPDIFESTSAAPDQYSYTIKVESKKGVKIITVADAAAPDNLQELINILNRLMRKRRTMH